MVSRALDCVNAAPIRLFHLLYDCPGRIYEIPTLHCLVAAEQVGSTLDLYDVCALQPLAWDSLSTCLDFPGVDTVRFGFNPDWMGVSPVWEDHAGSAVFVRGEMALPENFTFPLFIKT